MKNDKFKKVINEQALRDFARVSGYDDEDTVTVIEKPKRDPKLNKERDMRKLSKKDRWDD